MSGTVTFNLVFKTSSSDIFIIVTYAGNIYYNTNFSSSVVISDVPNGKYTYGASKISSSYDFSIAPDAGSTAVYPSQGTITVNNDSPTITLTIYTAFSGTVTATPTSGSPVSATSNDGYVKLTLNKNLKYTLTFSTSVLGDILNFSTSSELIILYNLTNSYASNSSIKVNNITLDTGSSLQALPNTKVSVNTSQSNFTTWYPQSLFTDPTNPSTDFTMPASDTQILAVSPVIYVLASGEVSGTSYTFMLSATDPPVLIKTGTSTGANTTNTPTIASFNLNGVFGAYNPLGAGYAPLSNLQFGSVNTPDGFATYAVVSDGKTIYIGTNNGEVNSPSGHIYAVSSIDDITNASVAFTPSFDVPNVGTEYYGVASLSIDNNGHLIVVGTQNDDRIEVPVWVLNTSDFSIAASKFGITVPAATGAVVYDGKDLIVSAAGTTSPLARYTLDLSFVNYSTETGSGYDTSQMLYDGTYIYLLQSKPLSGTQDILVFKDNTDLTFVTGYSVPEDYAYQIAYAGQAGTIWVSGTTTIYHIDGLSGSIISQFDFSSTSYDVSQIGGIAPNNPLYSSVYSTNGYPE